MKKKDGVLTKVEPSDLKLLKENPHVFWDSVSVIGYGAFKDLNDLKKIEFPENVVEIGDKAFQNCKKLKQVVLGGNVARIGNYAFKDCVSLKKVKVMHDEDPSIEIFTGAKARKTIEIGKYAYENCKKLCMYNGQNVVKLGVGSFLGCKKLSLYIPDRELSEYPDKCFEGCTSMKEIGLPTRMKVISKSFVSGCKRLENVNLLLLCGAISGNLHQDTVRCLKSGKNKFNILKNENQLVFDDKKKTVVKTRSLDII